MGIGHGLTVVAEVRDHYEPVDVLKRVFGNEIPKKPILCKTLCVFYNTKQCHCHGAPGVGICGNFVVNAASVEEAEQKIEALVAQRKLH
jgi:hypothetical protein